MSPSIALVLVWGVVFWAWCWKAAHRAAVVRGDFNIETWRRCDNCDGVLTRLDGASLTPHIGHRLRPAHDGLNPLEYLGVLVGWL